MAVADPALANRDIAEFTVRGVAATDVPDAVYDGLLALLARGLAALRDPGCARLIGPVVPGATMVHGARVPGTSYELDPVAAAFCIGVAASWPGTAAAADGWESFGALFAVSDYRARRAHHLALSAPCVRDLLAAMAAARQIEAALAREGGADRIAAAATGVRAASAAVTTRLLGGGVAQIAAAVSLALCDGDPAVVHPRAQGFAPGRPWAGADAASRGVRLALIALAASDDDRSEAAAGPEATAFGVAADQGSEPDVGAADRLAASVRAHFDARQAALILRRLADKRAVLAMPVHEFAAVLVRNA
ncbi:MAG: MmgE/PrpD family protein [Gammaproteobacteria bacterium]|nr:MmgE/PrpD family protein [Gammaproteobacteria bacterium]